MLSVKVLEYMGLDERKPDFVAHEQHRCRPACMQASAQSDRTFVICSFEIIIPKLNLCKISIFKLVSVAQHTRLSITQKTGFLVLPLI